jgi:phage terminase large subunit
VLLQGGTRCFVPETLVNTGNGYLPIKDIEIGDHVLSYNNSEIQSKKVLNKFMYKGEQSCIKLVTLVLMNGIKITSTYDHKHLQSNGWVKSIDIARRAIQRGCQYRWAISNKQYGETCNNELQEFAKAKSNETSFRCEWISKNNDKAEWGIQNNKDSQNSSGTLDIKSRKQSSSKSHKSYKKRQQIRKFRMGYSFGKHSAHDETWKTNFQQWFKKWDVKNDGRECNRSEVSLYSLCSDGKRFSEEIRNNDGANEGYIETSILEANIINIDEIVNVIFSDYDGIVYDIEVEDNHNFLITEKNYITHNSGKTHSVMDFIIYLCHKYNGLEIDVCRDTFTSLRATVYKEFKDLLHKYEVKFDHNKSEHIITINGNSIHFYGLDNDEKIHGKKRDLIWINEINQIKKDVYDQIAPRTKYRIIGDYNPRLGRRHWLDEYINRYPPLITTYKDNTFLTKDQIQDIESKKNDPYWWSVYGDGKRAAQVGAIFENWEFGDFNTNIPYLYGQDFGFSNDPTTLVKVAIDRKNKIIYAKELLYNANQLTTDDIYNINKRLIERPNDLIVADSAEPRLIYEIAAKGQNISKAVKGPNSVLYGITKILEYKIIITYDSKNLESELSNYVWNDKRAGIPIDSENHLIDAMRYAVIRLLPETNKLVTGSVGLNNLH